MVNYSLKEREEMTLKQKAKDRKGKRKMKRKIVCVKCKRIIIWSDDYPMACRCGSRSGIYKGRNVCIADTNQMKGKPKIQ